MPVFQGSKASRDIAPRPHFRKFRNLSQKLVLDCINWLCGQTLPEKCWATCSRGDTERSVVQKCARTQNRGSLPQRCALRPCWQGAAATALDVFDDTLKLLNTRAERGSVEQLTSFSRKKEGWSEPSIWNTTAFERYIPQRWRRAREGLRFSKHFWSSG